MEELHLIKYEGHDGARVIVMDSITHANETYGPGDVLVGASFMGVTAIQFATRHRPKALFGSDCESGLDGAGINGLWYADGAGLAAVAVQGRTAALGDGERLYSHGVVSTVNHTAEAMGARVGMTVEACAQRLADAEPVHLVDELVDGRTVVYEGPEGRILATDSIRFARDGADAVVCVGSHGGARTAVTYALEIMPRGFISSDGGFGLDDSGVSGLRDLESVGIPGATVSVHSARIGSGLSTYQDGIVSSVNGVAEELGVRIGMRASRVAMMMIRGDH